MTNTDRTWEHPFDFYVFSLGLTLGISTVWKFPYLVYANGGGAYLVAYLVMLLIIGLPMLFLELVLGQYSRVCPTKTIRRMVPILSTFGYATLALTAVITCCSLVVPARAAAYLAHSLVGDISWGRCGTHKHCQNWTSEYECFTREENVKCQHNDKLYVHCGCEERNAVCKMHGYTVGYEGDTGICATMRYCASDACTRPFDKVVEDHFKHDVISPQELFYSHHIAKFNWEFWIMPVVLWTVLALLLLLRERPYRWILYISIPFTFLLFTCELIYAAQLQGAREGLMFFLVPDWHSLRRLRECWHSAACHVLLNLGVGYGCHIHLASRNRFRNNVLRDAILVTALNAVCTFYVGIIAFCIVGHLAHNTNTDVDTVIKDTIVLPLVAYSTLVYGIPGSGFWASLQFATVIGMVMLSVCGGVSIIFSSIMQLYPKAKAHKTMVCCVASLALCLFTYVVFFFDLAVSIRVLNQIYTDWLLILALIEICMVSYIFGIKSFISIAKTMGHFVKDCRIAEKFWTIILAAVTPITLVLMIIAGWVISEPVIFDSINGKEVIMQSSWITDLIAILWVAGGCAYKWATVEEAGLGPGDTITKRLLRPTQSWYDRGREEAIDSEGVVIAPISTRADRFSPLTRGERPSTIRGSTKSTISRIVLPEMPPDDYSPF